MTEERIRTLNPEAGKRGVNIARSRYDAVREAILEVLRERPGTPFMELAGLARERLPGFEGSVSWYVTAVKLDLEARGEVRRIPGRGVQRLTTAGAAPDG